MFCCAIIVHHDTESAVFFTAGSRTNPVNDFFLQHKVHIANLWSKQCEMKQQGGGDVIGQISDNAQLRTQFGKIEFERIAGVYRELRWRIGLLQARD